MSALLAAVININLKLQKQNSEKKKNCTQTNCNKPLGHWDWTSSPSRRDGTSRRQHTQKIFSELHLSLALCSKLHLIRNDLFWGRSSDCTITSSWREEKMYNALSPLLSWGWEEGEFLWDVQVLVIDSCVCVFLSECVVRAFVCMCMHVVYLLCVQRRQHLVSSCERSHLVKGGKEKRINNLIIFVFLILKCSQISLSVVHGAGTEMSKLH